MCKKKVFYSSSSSCWAISTDIPDPLTLSLPIVHRFRQVLRDTPSILTELLNIGSSWSPCFCSAHVLHWSTSLMSSSLLLQQCPTCLVRLTLIVSVMGGRWPYSGCFVGCCLQDFFIIARSILVSLLSSFFSIRLVSVHVVHPYGSINTTAAWKKLRFILSFRSDFHMTDALSIAVHAFVSRALISVSVSVDETLLPRYVNLSASFRELLFSVEMSHVWLKHIYSVCVHWHGGQCLLPIVLDYAVGFRLGQLHLQESLCHRRTRRW